MLCSKSWDQLVNLMTAWERRDLKVESGASAGNEPERTSLRSLGVICCVVQRYKWSPYNGLFTMEHRSLKAVGSPCSILPSQWGVAESADLISSQKGIWEQEVGLCLAGGNHQ